MKGNKMAKNRHMHLDELRRRNEAAIRQEEREKRTISEQLALIAKRPGHSQKEFDRLMMKSFSS
jgi:hypothetical protein